MKRLAFVARLSILLSTATTMLTQEETCILYSTQEGYQGQVQEIKDFTAVDVSSRKKCTMSIIDLKPQSKYPSALS